MLQYGVSDKVPLFSVCFDFFVISYLLCTCAYDTAVAEVDVKARLLLRKDGARKS